MGTIPIAPSNGPFFHIAEFFFLYAGLFNDTVFIRITLILAQAFILVWTTLGAPVWPNWQNPERAALHLDSTIWCSLCIIVAGIPLLRQVTQREAKVSFACGAYGDEAEALWRDWYRRSGVPRADFRTILQACEWLAVAPGDLLPMKLDGLGFDSCVSESIEHGDCYYYVVGGQLDCVAQYREGERHFRAESGSFVDAFAMIDLFGQPTAGLAMQLGTLGVRVAPESTYSSRVPRVPPPVVGATSSQACVATPSTPLTAAAAAPATPSSLASGDDAKPGALLLRWRREDLVRAVVCAPGLACPTMRLVVTQSALDSLFAGSLPPGPRQRYDVIHEVRRTLNAAPLPLEVLAASAPRRRLQWWQAHVSWRDLWQPGQEQRALNAMRACSRECEELDPLSVHRADLGTLRMVASSPRLSGAADSAPRFFAS